jgi:hypothetical protein
VYEVNCHPLDESKSFDTNTLDVITLLIVAFHQLHHSDSCPVKLLLVFQFELHLPAVDILFPRETFGWKARSPQFGKCWGTFSILCLYQIIIMDGAFLLLIHLGLRNVYSPVNVVAIVKTKMKRIPNCLLWWRLKWASYHNFASSNSFTHQ